MIRRVWFSVGSNLGDRLANLQTAVDALAEVGSVRTSRVYETEPVGVDGQPHFLNAVLELATDLPPQDLLHLCTDIENAAGRVRTERWGARKLDVDIIAIDGETVDQPDLQVPHPRAHQRGFVLIPLRELVSTASLSLPEPTPAGSEAVVLTDHQLHVGER